MAANRDFAVHCRTAKEADAAFRAGKCAAFLSVEGAELLDCDLEKLDEAYRLGVRAVNITWNHANVLSGSNAEEKDRGCRSGARRLSAGWTVGHAGGRVPPVRARLLGCGGAV